MSDTAGFSIATPRRVAPLADLSAVPVLTTRKVDGQEWDAVISRFDGVCQEQLLTFARRRWPGVRQEPLVFSAGGEIVGG